MATKQADRGTDSSQSRSTTDQSRGDNQPRDLLKEQREADEKALREYDGPDIDNLKEEPAVNRLQQEKQSPLRAAKADTAQVAVGDGDGAPVIGGFVTVDLEDSGVKEALEAVPEAARPMVGNFAVFHELRGDSAFIQFRDDTHVFATVPVKALRAAGPRGR